MIPVTYIGPSIEPNPPTGLRLPAAAGKVLPREKISGYVADCESLLRGGRAIVDGDHGLQASLQRFLTERRCVEREKRRQKVQSVDVRNCRV
ncbi:MAG: hypothetical protein WB822_05515, partial [Rhodoplanes sp.]